MIIPPQLADGKLNMLLFGDVGLFGMRKKCKKNVLLVLLFFRKCQE